MTTRAEKEANAAFWAYRRQERLHVRVGQRHQDGTQITLHGSAAELHGPGGVCVCCGGRAPKEPTHREPAGHPARAAGGRLAGVPSAAQLPTTSERVAALIHPRAAHVRQYRGSATVDIAAVHDAMRRFRPGQALDWTGA